MKESRFVEQNKKKWSNFDRILEQKSPNPVDLNRLFVELTDDLSYARSKYRNRSVRVYLNWMMQRIFRKLYRRKKVKFSDFISFFKDDIPHVMYTSRRYMRASFLVFVLGVIIGVHSTINDPGFASLVLGEDYVRMTLENIENGEPMAVYQDDHPEDMFYAILVNNARIDVMVFATGLLFGVISLFILIRNAIMVGVFQFFFYQHGGFSDSVMTIWMHGAIEMSTLVLICGAGMLGGSGLLFPGTRTRFQAFRISGLKAVKLLIAILPFTLVAAFIETYVTPLAVNEYFKIVFILVTLGFMIFYFAWYPRYRFRGESDENRYTEYLPYVRNPKVSLTSIKSAGEVIIDTFYLYSKMLGKILKISALAVVILLLANKWLSNDPSTISRAYSGDYNLDNILEFLTLPNIWSFIQDMTWETWVVVILAMFGVILVASNQFTRNMDSNLVARFRPGWGWLLIVMVIGGALYIGSLTDYILLEISTFVIFLWTGMFMGFLLDSRRKNVLKGKFVDIFFTGMGHSLSNFILMLIMVSFMFLLIYSPVMLMYMEIVKEYLGSDIVGPEVDSLMKTGIALLVGFALIPLFFIAGILSYYRTVEQKYSIDLETQLNESGLI